MMKSNLFLAVAAAACLASCGAPPRTMLTRCEISGSGPLTRTLVIGDSWATFTQLDEAMGQAIAKRGGGSAQACSLGFSGHTAGEIAAQLPSLKGKFAAIVVLVGVNDSVRHVGSRNYARGVTDIAKQASTVGPVYLVSVPHVLLSKEVGSTQGKVKHVVYRWLFDRGEREVTERYRKAAPKLPTISFSDFIPSYVGHEDRYAADGIHLKDEEYAKLGTFLGERIPLSGKGP
jgi:lysophospholipase L1-like esterase